MSVGGSEHKVFLYKNDFNTMCTEVYRHQHIETGGNLFGLWTTSGNAVVQVVVGPGKDCKRTDVSFSQDIEYMKHVGEFLNEKFMLCHIGEWHSYHHLTLNKPSDGDRRTVRNNYPQGVKKFLVIFANIEGNDRVVLSPYFFTDNGYTCEKAEFQVLDADSPFTSYLSHRTIARGLDIGSENQQPQSEPTEPMDITPTNNHQPSRDGSRRSANQQQSSGGNSSLASDDNRTASQRNKNSSSSVTDYAGTVKSRSGDASARNSSTTPQGETPPPDYPGADSARQQNGRNPSLDQTTETGVPHESGPLSASQTPATTNHSSSNRLQSVENEKQTRKDIMLKKVHDEIQSNFHPREIDIQGNPSGDIKMKFKHKDYLWLIEFPKRFPEEPAKISSCYHFEKPERFVTRRRITKPQALNNYIGILLSIKRSCSSFSCSPCKKITAESLTQADPSLSLFLTEKGNAMLKELYDKTKTKSWVADPGSFKREMKYDFLQDEAILEVSFTHSSKLWVVTLTSTFPDSPAKVGYKAGNYGGLYTVRLLSADYTVKKLNSVSNILLAISKECRCEKCKDFVKKNSAI